MFFRFRKIYFKLYHLLKFLGIFVLALIVLMPSVKAEECVDILSTAENPHFYFTRYNYNEFVSSNSPIYKFNTYYTFFVGDGSQTLGDYFDSKGITAPWITLFYNGYHCDNSLTYCTDLSPSSNISFLNFFGSDKTSILDSLISDFHIVEGDSICNSSEPEEPIIDTDNPITEFYSLYLDKLGMLANYSLENKYLLSFIGVILLFILLELFLLLFKGGKRR